MKTLRAVVRVAAVASAAWLAAAVTGPDLLWSLRVSGWFPPGEAVETVAVTRKWHQPGPEGTYWVSWAEGSVLAAETPRLNVSADLWRALSVGDRLEIGRAPGSLHPALRETLAVPPRVAGLKAAFLLLELALGLVAARPLFRRLRRARARRSAGRDNLVLTVSPDFVFRQRREDDSHLVFTEEEAR